MILDKLNENLIFTKIEVDTNVDAIKYMADHFVKLGYCKTEYISSLIKRENEYPTGLNIDGIGVAIPHTDTNLVNEESLGMAILSKPVSFIEMGTDDVVMVDIIFMLAVKEAKEHIESLQGVINMIQNKKILNAIRGSDKKEQVVEIIKNRRAYYD